MERGLYEARIELYNAAVAYAKFVTGDSHDYDEAMAVANRLEEAAEAFVGEIENAPTEGAKP